MSDKFLDIKKHQFYTSLYFSPIGNLLILAEKGHLLRLDFEDEKARKRIETLSVGEEVFQIDIASPFLPHILQETKNWLDAYFSKRKPFSSLPIKFKDTPFRMLVWNLLLDIPYGKTVSYKEVAHLVAKARGAMRMSAQAIGQAVGKNPISIIVPCHRVIGKTGNLIGYGGGLERKKFLLELEEN